MVEIVYFHPDQPIPEEKEDAEKLQTFVLSSDTYGETGQRDQSFEMHRQNIPFLLFLFLPKWSFLFSNFSSIFTILKAFVKLHNNLMLYNPLTVINSVERCIS